MKYRCLVMDHDDTVVRSTATIHYPCFREYMHRYHPDMREYTFEDYFLKNFDPGVVAFFRDELGMDEAECEFEQTYWKAYAEKIVPEAYPGIREILERQKAEGGFICVVSHSYASMIRRDYRANGLPEPDLIFGWEEPMEQRKPNPYPLQETMRRLKLKPEELLVVDDMKPGYDMACAAGVPFLASGWANDIPQIERFMRSNCDFYCKTVADFSDFLQNS